MIDPSVLLTLKTKNELRIANLLNASEEPMRHKDIAATLQINKQRCTNALKTLVENKIIVQYEKFGITIYESSRLQNESGGLQNESSGLQNESSGLQNESLMPQSPLVSCEISVQERNSELKKERKGRNLLTLMRKRLEGRFRCRMYLLSRTSPLGQ